MFACPVGLLGAVLFKGGSQRSGLASVQTKSWQILQKIRLNLGWLAKQWFCYTEGNHKENAPS